MSDEKEQKQTGHRLARVRVNLECIARWITDGAVIATQCESSLKAPRVRDVRWLCERTNAAELLIEDESLPLVQDGVLSPRIDIAYRDLPSKESEL